MAAVTPKSRSAQIAEDHFCRKGTKSIALCADLKLHLEGTQKETNDGEKNIPKSIGSVKKDILRTGETRASDKTATKPTPAP